MPDGRINPSKPLLTRRNLLVAAPLVALGGVVGGIALRTTDKDAPMSLGQIGPFRQVYVTPRDDQSAVDIALAYPFGERHNPYEEGLAHYLEHLAWRNATGAGTDGGSHSNALTSPHATVYFLSRPADALTSTLERLAATAAPLSIDTAYALQERDIVQREFDQSRLENPLDATWVEMTNSLFGGSPFARATLGSKNSIDQFTLGTAQQLHDETHQLATATLLVRGPVDQHDVRNAIGQIQNWPSPRAIALATDLPLWPETDHDLAMQTVGGLARGFVVQQKTFAQPAGFDWAEILAARNILENLALSTKAGSLARPLRYDTFLASTIDFDLSPIGTAGLVLTVEAEPDTGVELQDLNAALTDKLTDMLSAPDEQSFAELKDSEISWVESVLDPLKANHDRLFRSVLSGRAYVPLANLRTATQDLSYARFRSFTRHLLEPRSAVTRLISNN